MNEFQVKTVLKLNEANSWRFIYPDTKVKHCNFKKIRKTQSYVNIVKTLPEVFSLKNKTLSDMK